MGRISLKSVAPGLFCAGLILAVFTETGQAQTDVDGYTARQVGPGLSSVEFYGKNKTGRRIYDFSITIDGALGVNITEVTVTSEQSGGADDWDVDDNLSGASNEAGQPETDDLLNNPSRNARVDSGGTGNEADPQSQRGRPIGTNQKFRIKLTFSGTTANAGTLHITPTDENNVGYCSLTPDGMQDGENVCTIYNGTAFIPGVAVAAVNATGSPISALEFQTTGDYHLTELLEISPQTGATIQRHQCDLATTSTLTLARQVQPGDIVAFDALFDGISAGENTSLTVIPFESRPIPGVGPLGLVVMAIALAALGAAMLLALKRRRPAA